jgi:hypothetical protein
MATPTTIITAALRHLGVIGEADSSVEAGDADLCLNSLRSMLDAWNLSPQNCVGLQELTYTPGSGVTSFTIGPSGNVVSRQPAEIVKATYRRGETDWPVDVVSVAEYAGYSLKSTSSTPCAIAMNRGDDTATVFVYPAADGSSQLRMWVSVDVIDSFDTIGLTTTLTLPNGYQNALEWCLAEEVSDSFSVPGDKLSRVIRKAGIAQRRIKRTNSKVPQLDVLGGYREYDIEGDI